MYQLFDYQQKLVNSIRQALTEGHKGALIVSPSGSGKSVVIAEIARLTTEKGGNVLFLAYRKELVDQIKDSFIKQGVNLNNYTIMTVGKVANRLEKIPKPNLIVVDESQHSRAKTYLKIFNYFSDVPRLGFTGSPWRLSSKGFKDVYSKMIEGLSVKWLIENHKLTPFTMYGYRLGDKSKLERGSTGDYTNKSLEDFSKSVIRGDITKSWQRFAKGRKTTVYCHSVQFAKEVAKAFRGANISAYEADSKTPEKERDKIMRDFKDGKITVLCNCDLISEGFNVPDCSCMVLLRPTESLVVYLQQSMRCMRHQPGKQAIIIGQVGSFTRFGLPDTDRTWTLEDRTKHPQRESGSDGIAIKTCPNYFGVTMANYHRYPLHGYNFEAEFRKLAEDKRAELEKINLDAKEMRERKKGEQELLLRDPSTFTIFEEFTIYDKAMGHKPGWAWHRVRVKGLIK